MRQFILSIFVFCSSAMLADNIKRPDSYNYSRGVEAVNNDNAEEALDYLTRKSMSIQIMAMPLHG